VGASDRWTTHGWVAGATQKRRNNGNAPTADCCRLRVQVGIGVSRVGIDVDRCPPSSGVGRGLFKHENSPDGQHRQCHTAFSLDAREGETRSLAVSAGTTGRAILVPIETSCQLRTHHRRDASTLSKTADATDEERDPGGSIEVRAIAPESRNSQRRILRSLIVLLSI
jgi:hypothetical protein